MYSIPTRSPLRPWMAAALVVLLFPAAGCGKKTEEAVAPTAAPDAQAAVPARIPLGAETPEALVARMKKAAENEDLREMAACMEPEARKEMAEGMFLGASMMVAFSGMAQGMGEMAGEMAGAVAGAVGGDEAAADVKEQVAEGTEAAGVDAAGMAERFNALLAKHGLPTLDDESEAGKEVFDKALADADQVAFIGDIADFLETEMKGEEGSASKTPMFEGELTELQIDGDYASGKLGEEMVEFVRIDGRWFAKEPARQDAPDRPGI